MNNHKITPLKLCETLLETFSQIIVLVWNIIAFKDWNRIRHVHNSHASTCILIMYKVRS